MVRILGSESCKSRLLVGVVLALAVFLVAGHVFEVQAQLDSDNDGISDAKELELASLYAPSLQFKSGERFFPVDVEYHLDGSVLKQRTGETVTIVDTSPSVSSISMLGADYFLASEFGSIADLAADYESKRATLGYTVYTQVKTEAQTIVVQYWLFYAYNDAPINEHEGDWEMIMIFLDSSETPVSAVYSQHLQGQRTSWGDVDKDSGTHPKVYVAKGSHANYFRSYQGRLGLESDDVGADGFALNSGDLTVVMLGEIESSSHPPSQDWLSFGGRWGNWAELADAAAGFAGPYGPGHGDNSDKWFSPVSWAEGVSSVGGNWFTASLVASNFLFIVIAVTGALAAWKVWKIVKLQRSGGFRLPAFLRTRVAIGIGLGALSIVLTIAGILLPWYLVRANIQTAALSTQGEADLLMIDGQRGVLVNLLVGGKGLSPVFGLQMPLGLLLLIGVVLGILDIIGVDKVRGLGNKYLRGGMAFLVVFIILILFIVQLTSLIQSLAAAFGVTLPPEANQIAQAIAQQPLQGMQSETISDFGSVSVSWGLGLGAFMILAAAIVKLAAGIYLRRVPELQLQPGKTANTQTSQN